MIDIRQMTESDKPALQDAITRDVFHPGEWKVEHFDQPNILSQVIEDSQGPIAFVRFTKTLRISCVWNDGENVARNARAIIFGIQKAVERARASGYTEIIITTSHDKLAKFFVKVMKMTRSDNEFILQV